MLEPTRGSLFPVLPLRDIVVFPHMIVPLFVGREKSVRALEDVMKDDKQILLVTQKNAAQDDPTPADIYSALRRSREIRSRPRRRHEGR
jgi:ATP-dependent Lon protease